MTHQALISHFLLDLIAPSNTQFLPKIAGPPHAAALQQQSHQQKAQESLFNAQSTVSSAPMDLENENSTPNCEHSDGCDNSELVFNIPQSFMMLPGVMMDPSSLLGLQQFPILNLPQAVNAGQQQAQSDGKNESSKEIIHCPSCTLIPPNPNAPMPSTRERPAGCRTVFVGGLPENVTEAIIHEVSEEFFHRKKLIFNLKLRI